jgi:hypothetical protein
MIQVVRDFVRQKVYPLEQDFLNSRYGHDRRQAWQ